MTIGQKLKNLRESRGKTQTEVCKVVNIEQSTLANYENDRRSPKADILKKLSTYYGVPVSYFIDEGDDNDILYVPQISERILLLATKKPIDGILGSLKTNIVNGITSSKDLMHDIYILSNHFGVSDEYLLGGDDADRQLTASGWPDGALTLVEIYTDLSPENRKRLLSTALQLHGDQAIDMSMDVTRATN